MICTYSGMGLWCIVPWCELQDGIHRTEDTGQDMQDKLTFNLLSREPNASYDWMNIDCGNTRVGKVRGIIDAKTLTISSINIFPEFEGQGYGKMTVDMFKESFDTIVADRVRYTAIGFWVKMGFLDNKDGNYVYYKK